MKRLFALVSLLLALPAFALPGQLSPFSPNQVIVTGTVEDPSGALAASGYVQFDLLPQSPSTLYTVAGVATLTQTARCAINGGSVQNLQLTDNCRIWGNDVISPANTTYRITFAPNNIVTLIIANAVITGANPVDLSTLTTVNQGVVNGTAVTANPLTTMSLVPANADSWTVGSALLPYLEFFSDTYSVNQYVDFVLGPAPTNPTATGVCRVYGDLPSGNVLGVNSTGAACLTSGSGVGAVSSVFGRTGAVTATSGDYALNQIGNPTAAVTLQPTVDATITIQGANVASPVQTIWRVLDKAGNPILRTNPDDSVVVGSGAGGSMTGTSFITPNGANPPNNQVSLLNLQAAKTAITGNGSAQTVYTYTIPGSTMNASACVEAEVVFSHSTGTAAVTYQWTFGGTSIVSYAPTATGIARQRVHVCNIASVSSQQMFSDTTTFGVTPTNVGASMAFTTAALNTASGQPLAFTFNVANTDQVTPDEFRVWLQQ